MSYTLPCVTHEYCFIDCLIDSRLLDFLLDEVKGGDFRCPI